MEFFNSAIDVLQTLVIALGGGLCVWGGINLLEGYGQDNPAAKSQGVKQLVAGGGVALIGVTLIPPAVRPAWLSGGRTIHPEAPVSRREPPKGGVTTRDN